MEGDGTLRNGTTMLDSVEVYNCSQYDTMNAALRFEGSGRNFSVISNSVLHHGHAYGVMLLNTANVTF